MRIFIDADGCPVVNETIRLAQKLNIPVTVVKNYAHELQSEYAEIVTVDISRDAADFYIANHLKHEDVLITQDYGLAALALSKKCIFILHMLLSVQRSGYVSPIIFFRFWSIRFSLFSRI